MIPRLDSFPWFYVIFLAHLDIMSLFSSRLLLDANNALDCRSTLLLLALFVELL